MRFLSFLSKQSGGGSPANGYTQTTSCNGINLQALFIAAIVFICIAIISLFIYSVISKPQANQSQAKDIIPTNSKESIENSEESD